MTLRPEKRMPPDKVPTIKFAHWYDKLGPGENTTSGRMKRATLLHVQKVRLEDLSPELIDYDTCYGGGEHYSLHSKGNYLLLLFRAEHRGHHIFTTLRRYTPWKAEYYKGLVGFEFKVELENEEA